MLNKDLVLLWIQGCGKWTQADLLLKNLPNHMYFEMWETLRTFHLSINMIWNYMKDCMNRWDMVDNFITSDLMDISLKIAQKNNKQLLIDWYPRLEEQVEYFLPRMNDLNRDFIVIHYTLPKETAIDRMMKRAQLEWRKDDNIQAIHRRIEIFETQTLKIINKIKDLWKVIEIDANNTIENIFQETLEKLQLKWLE